MRQGQRTDDDDRQNSEHILQSGGAADDLGQAGRKEQRNVRHKEDIQRTHNDRGYDVGGIAHIDEGDGYENANHLENEETRGQPFGDDIRHLKRQQKAHYMQAVEDVDCL